MGKPESDPEEDRFTEKTYNITNLKSCHCISRGYAALKNTDNIAF